MRRRSPLRCTLFALAAWAAVVPAARAQAPRTIVLRFEGWRADAARDAVLRAIAPEVQLVSEERAIAAAEELGIDVTTPEGMARVVEHLGVTLVVAGSVEGRSRRAQTVVMVLDTSGNELARRGAPAPRSDGDRAAIGEAAIEALREARELLEQRNAPEPPPEPEPAPAPPAPPPEPAPQPAAEWRQRQVLVLAGVRLRTVGTYVHIADVPGQYFAADAYPEIDLELFLRPWVDKRDAVRGIFLGLQGGFSVGIRYVTTEGDQSEMTSLRFRVDAGYGHVLGDAFELQGMIGFGIEGVQLSSPDGFPSTLFSYLRPALAGRLRLVPDFLILEAGVGARIGLDGGPLAAAFGPGMFFGGADLFFGVAGAIDAGFSWAARVGYTHHALSFSGDAGTLGNGRSGVDEVIEGRFLIGWSF
ncbi:MAG TPA: hypothetical protein VIL20_07360 [Sandaracinaceae bacterium]